MTWRELCRKGALILRDAGIAGAEADARSLLFASSGMTLTSYAFRAEEPAPDAEEEKFFELVSRRSKREPLQYILGFAPFYGRDFIVNEGVLIPRFDTETLVEALTGYLKPGTEILDLCTGSGCILISLMLEGPGGISGTGSDISEKALSTAARNAVKFGVKAEFLNSNLFENITGTYDIITANPPYIRSAEIDGLAPEVSEYEPRIALDGGEDGLDFMRRIISEAPAHLRDGGVLGLEIGYDESEDVSGLMREYGFRSVSVRRDLAWNTRAVIGVMMRDKS